METKTMIIYHDFDLDGWCCRYLLEKIYSGNALYEGYNYGNPSLDGKKLASEDWWLKFNCDDYIFADITPTDYFIDKIIESNKNGIKKNIYIFDHHISRYNSIIEKYGEYINTSDDCIIKYYFDNNYSGCKIIQNCVLSTFIEKMEYKKYPKFPEIFYSEYSKYYFSSIRCIQLINIIDSYDTWKFDSLEDKQEKLNILGFIYYLYSIVNNYIKFKIEIDKLSDSTKSILEYCETGKSIINQIQIENNKSILLGKIQEINDNNFYLIGTYPNYFLGNQIQKSFNVDGYIGYQIDLKSNNVKLSIRTFNDVDASEVAKFFDQNGGGHKKAAGATISIERFFEFLTIMPIK